MGALLRIRLFGGLDVEGSVGDCVTPATPSSRNLLAYLALQPDRRFPREMIAGALWPERSERAALKALRNSLWRLRGATVGIECRRLIHSADGQITLAPGVWVDVAAFDLCSQRLPRAGTGLLTPEQYRTLEHGVRLYRGDLLDGFYEAWASVRREELRAAFLDLQEALRNHDRTAGDLRGAVRRGRRMLRHNPFLEHVHRDLMLCYWMAGDRPMAVRQFKRCERLLRRELDITPMHETMALLERILQERPPTDGSAGLIAGGRRHPPGYEPPSPPAREGRRYPGS